ncbi:MAG: M20/M25/M40 family metallo-hydrolase [Fibrobacter sp.]|jgi:acetylornithine deacetylase/succinyl-diaminopimelate desuccinylase-like protein|nr:M20/M25/M40 family metallo-hydrolase [Fibrobacter sp.]
MKEAFELLLQANFQKYLEILNDLIRIPSVSFENFDRKNVEHSALFLKNLLEKEGFENAQLLTPPGGHSSVFAEIPGKTDVPVILLYAHHDVQPPLRKELWKSPPFEPEIRNGRLYGRGSADDKAGIVLHLAAARLVKEALGERTPHLKILIEGEEEIGSPGLEFLLKEHAVLLKNDAVIVADLSNFAKGVPALTASLRGMTAAEVKVSALEAPLHSGSWSGPIPDPVQALCRMIASLTDDEGKIIVKNFSDTVAVPTNEEKEKYAALRIKEKTFRKDSGLLDGVAFTVPENLLPETLWRAPSVTVTAMETPGGFENVGNVLQNTARARISIRLAPGMDSKTAVNALTEHLKSVCPFHLHLSVTAETGAEAVIIDTSHPYFRKMFQALETGYGTEAKIIGCGATIPGVILFQKAFGEIPVLLLGVEDPECNAHGENESLYLEDFKKSILSEALFFHSVMEINSFS